MNEAFDAVTQFFARVWSTDSRSRFMLITVCVITALYLLSHVRDLLRQGARYYVLAKLDALNNFVRLPFVFVCVALGSLVAAEVLATPMFAVMHILQGNLHCSHMMAVIPKNVTSLEYFGYFCAALSLYTILVFALDKSIARLNGEIGGGTYKCRAKVNPLWRRMERELHLFELSGGWPGSLIAQRLFRHKIAKDEYQREFVLCVACNCLMVAAVVSHIYEHPILAYFLLVPAGLAYYRILNRDHDKRNREDDQSFERADDRDDDYWRYDDDDWRDEGLD
ncbi:MAG: DUF1294 domain-containing protein [Planctomycetaceae bacterium]